jgi:hypothetical protein
MKTSNQQNNSDLETKFTKLQDLLKDKKQQYREKIQTMPSNSYHLAALIEEKELLIKSLSKIENHIYTISTTKTSKYDKREIEQEKLFIVNEINKLKRELDSLKNKVVNNS